MNIKKSRAVAVVIAAGLTASVFAQPDEARIDVKGRLKGATDWVDLVDVSLLPGQAAEFEIAVFYKFATTNGAFALSTCVNSPVVNGWRADLGDVVTLLDRPDSVQHPDGRQGRYNYGSERQAWYTGGVNDTGRLRISRPNNTQANPAGGVVVKQNIPSASGTLLDRSNPALGYRFDISLLADPAGGTRFAIADVPRHLVNSFSAYNTEAGDTSNQLNELQPTDPFTVNITTIPAPAGLAVLLAITPAAFRRRRGEGLGVGSRV